MKLIVGLGNPGKKYQYTRHNVGFLFLDALREKFLYRDGVNVSDWEDNDMFNSSMCVIREGSRIVAILQKPLTFMNNSGDAVAKVIRKYNIDDLGKNLILVHDDLDLKFGKYKIQVGKSPKGHNGVNNVLLRLGGKQDFETLRIGIDDREPNNKISGEDFVLMKFTKDEMDILDEVIATAVSSLLPEILF